MFKNINLVLEKKSDLSDFLFFLRLSESKQNIQHYNRQAYNYYCTVNGRPPVILSLNTFVLVWLFSLSIDGIFYFSSDSILWL